MHCRRYALEAIINDIIYLRVHIMFMFHAITAMVLESAITRGSEEDSYARVE